MARETFVAIDCGASSVALASFVLAGDGRLSLTGYSRERLEDSGASTDSESGVDWADFVFGRLAKRISCRGPAMMTLPGHHVVTRWLEAPAVDTKQREKILQFEASQSPSASAGESVWDYYPLMTDDGRVEAMLASAKLTVVDALCGAAERAGFRLERVLPPVVALFHAFRFCCPDAEGPFAVVNVGARTTQVMYVEGARFGSRTVSLGGNAVTRALMDDLKVDWSQAERIKLEASDARRDGDASRVEDAVPAGGYFSGSTLSGAAVVVAPVSELDRRRTAVSRATDMMVSRLQLEITRTLVSQRRPDIPSRAAPVYLAGGGSLLPELAERLESRLKVSVRQFDGLRNVTHSSALATAAGGPAVFADLVGMAATRALDSAPAFNLLPHRRKRTAALRKRQPALVGATALAVVALAFPIWHYDRVVKIGSAKIDEIETLVKELTEVKNRNRENLTRIAAIDERIAAGREAVISRQNWLRFFADLQDRLATVEDVWLERVQKVAEAAGSVTVGNPRLNLSGRLLDSSDLLSGDGSQSESRVRSLLGLLGQSPFVEVVENERFDRSQPLTLRFEITLRLKAGELL